MIKMIGYALGTLYTKLYFAAMQTTFGHYLYRKRLEDGRFKRFWDYYIADHTQRLRAASRPVALQSKKPHSAPGFSLTHQPCLQRIAFTERCICREAELEADIYISHDVLPLPAAHILASRTGGRVFCDGIETPWFNTRAISTRWANSAIETIHLDTKLQLAQCDRILTVGPTLGKEYETFGAPVTVVENYRYREDVVPNKTLREQCSLNDSDHLVLCMSTIASGFEAVIEAMRMLPENVHLATLGKFAPASYEKHIKQIVPEKGLTSRVHFFDPIPYAQLTSTVGGADIGLIVRDPGILNNFASLPNRVFDYISSSLPFCSPNIPDIAKIIRENNIGSILMDCSPQEWARAISEAIAQKDVLKANTRALAKSLTWETREPILLNTVDGARKVTFLGIKDLGKNNRTLRMAKTLAQNGIEVTVAYRGFDIPKSAITGVTFIPLGACLAC